VDAIFGQGWCSEQARVGHTRHDADRFRAVMLPHMDAAYGFAATSRAITVADDGYRPERLSARLPLLRGVPRGGLKRHGCSRSSAMFP